MTLSRTDLENDQLRQFLCKSYPAAQVLTPEQLEASIDAMLSAHPEGEDVWLFGYGSLIWNPCLDFAERRVVRLHGHHRSFCVWSHMGRGTREHPGLVLGLDSGGSCHGVAFRIEAAKAKQELRLIWRREMLVGAYCPKWVRVDSLANGVVAIAFTVNRGHPSYAGKLPVETVARNLVSARGHLGTPAEYLHATVQGLGHHGVRDNYLMRLARMIAVPPANPA